MADVILWARLDDPTPAVQALEWPDIVSYMYLEQVPHRWVSAPDMEKGLSLRHLDPNLDFRRWERARLFCQNWELRWEKQDGLFWCVYVGSDRELPDFERAPELDLSIAEPVSKRCYYLWGLRVSDAALDIVGADPQPGTQVFLELRVPRLLRYPVSSDARRVKLVTCEYIDPASGQTLYHRCHSLQEESCHEPL